MQPEQVAPARLAAFGADAIESDCVYFEAAAERVDLPGATLAWMPSALPDPAACVVQRVDPAAVGDHIAWIDDVEARHRELGAPTVRVYLTTPAPDLEAALAARGYECREEIAYVRHEPFPSRRSDVVLRPVTTEADWADKLRLHEECMERPDGYENVAERWVALERAKCDAGAMHAYLVESNAGVIGAIGAIDLPSLSRAKNIVVHRDARRQGMAAEAIRLLLTRARDHGLDAIAIFGIRGEPGDALYRGIGMEPVASQFEWSRSLAGWTP